MVHDILTQLPVTHLAIEGFDRSVSIGGTDISVICGVNKYEKVQDLYKRKQGLLPEKESNAPMEWGGRHEPAIRKKLRDMYPSIAVLEPEKDYPGVMTSKETPWAHCSPDGFLFDRNTEELSILEIKTASMWSKKMWGSSGSQVYPTAYRYQIQWYLYITGLKKARLAALIGLSDFREYEITRNDKLIADMVGHAKDFIESLAGNNIPSNGVAANIAKTMLAKYPTIEHPENYSVASSRDNKVAERLLWIKDKVKELNGEKKALQEALKKSIGDNEGVQGDTWKARWSRFSKRKTDWDRIEAEGGVDAHLKEEYTTTKPSERFDIKKTT